MASIRSGIDPTPKEFESIQFWFGFMPEHGIQFLSEGSTIYQPPVEKISILLAIFEVRFHLPVFDFFSEVIREYGFSVHDLTSNSVDKIVGFKLGCRALSVVPHFQAFQFL